jgi:hypothetical protein
MAEDASGLRGNQSENRTGQSVTIVTTRTSL